MKRVREFKSRLKETTRKLIESNEEPSQSSTPPSSGVSSQIISKDWADLKGCWDALDQAASASGLGPLKTAIEAIAGCIGIYEQAEKGQKAYTELRGELERTFKRMQEYITNYPVVAKNISGFCQSIQQEIDYIQTQQSRTRVRRLAEAEQDEDTILSCYKRIRDRLQDLCLDMTVSTLATVEQHAMDDRLEKLAPVLAARYNAGSTNALKRRRCTEGTRTNVLDQIYQWATTQDTGDLYWMSGMAGTGKTTIAYSLCERLDVESKRILGASFFCDRSLPECRNVGKIIPSIAYQLARRLPPFQYALCDAIQTNPDSREATLSLQFDSLIVGPLSNPKVRAALPASMAVVVDALDECEDAASTKQIIDVLSTKSKGLPIKFIVSSRPEAAIRDQMKKSGSLVDGLVVLHELKREEVRKDIRTYLKVELAPVNPSEPEIEKLAERAGVLFIHAATVIRYVGYDDFGRNPRARLNAVLSASVHPSKTQTDEIDQLYGAILQTAVNDAKLEQRERNDMTLILNTVVCAKAPLTVNGLNELLALEDVERVKAALRPLWSVLHVGTPNEEGNNESHAIESKMRVTTLHASFYDYLTDPTRSGGAEWHCNAAAHNHILAQRCFECIRYTRPQFNICQLESSHLDDSEVENLDARAENSISVQLRYACQYWSVHMLMSESGTAPALVILLEQFLVNNLLLWIEVQTLTKRLATSPGNLTSAKRWATEHGATPELLDLIQDAVRFALTYISSPLSQSTPHIYISMLPFLPSHSAIRKHYAHRMDGIIQVDGTALDRRKTLLTKWTVRGSSHHACSNDGNLFAIYAYSGGHIDLRDTSSGRLVGKLSLGVTWGVYIKHLTFSPDGALIAAGTSKGIYIWDIASGQLVLKLLEDSECTIESILFSQVSHIISGCGDNTIRIWDTQSGESVLAPLMGHPKAVCSLAVSRDGTKLISGSRDSTIGVWDMQSGRLLYAPITGHTDAIVSVAISSNNGFIASSSKDRTLRVWDIQTGQIILGPFLYEEKVSLLAFSPDGAYLSIGCSLEHHSSVIQIMDMSSGKVVFRRSMRSLGGIGTLLYSSDGTRIIVSTKPTSAHVRVDVLDAQRATVAMDCLPTTSHAMEILAIDFSPDGKFIVSGSADSTLSVWDPANGQLILGPLSGHTGCIKFVRYSPDGNRILSCSWDSSLRQWDAQTGGPILTDNQIKAISTSLSWHDRPRFVSAAYSPNSGHIATISAPITSVSIWDSGTGEMIAGPMLGEGGGKSIEYSADGTILITGWDDGTVRAWNAQNSQLISCIAPQGVLHADVVAFSSDQSYNVVSQRDPPTMYQRKTQTGENVLGAFEGHTSSITSAQFSRDGTRIVSGSWDRNVHVWDAQTGASIFGPLKGHTKFVKCVAYSPDGAYVASASSEKTVRIWDARVRSDEHSTKVDWMLNDDGWVVDAESRRLIWVPPDLRKSLMWPRNIALLSQKGWVRLKFDGALMGENWAKCWLNN
ncbi:unnamed protein product [Rhizoctonia solani]|uniref:Vegetative incompatibility protein HET-E-1 n=1 Tax=Rhizoctonia solani TaxID=456999 RepID=A0A8H3DX39_9AGAM|nr:unnamed protein product [Rhizoctonia solani]